MKKLLFFSYLILSSFVIVSAQKAVKIDWVDNLEGDYSFVDNWDYKDPVYLNDYGQLVCDGLCDPKTDNMKDETGKIYQDSLVRYYQLVDTTHVYHTIECETNSYEFAGTNNVFIQEKDNNVFMGLTLCSAATHSSLQFIIMNNMCIPLVKLESIKGNTIFYRCEGGNMKIDKQLWDKGIFKAEFDFVFDEDIWWKGKIYSKIN